MLIGSEGKQNYRLIGNSATLDSGAVSGVYSSTVEMSDGVDMFENHAGLPSLCGIFHRVLSLFKC